MAQTVVEQLVVELRARTDQAETRLREVEKQLDRTSKKGKEAGAAAGDLGGKYAGAAQQMASAAENMARSGQVTGDAAKQMVQQGAGMAMMFGATGPIVGAVAIAGLAIFELFDRARKEMETTRRKADDELRQMARSRDVGGLARRATELYSGDAFVDPESGTDDSEKRKLQAQKLGILGMRTEIKRLQDEAARGELGGRGMREVGGQMGGRMVQNVKAAREEMADEVAAWQRDLEEFERQNAEAQRRLFGTKLGEGVVARGVSEEQNRFAIERDEKAKTGGKSAGDKAAAAAEREASQSIERIKKEVSAWASGLAGGMKTVQEAVLKGTATMLDDMRASIETTDSELKKLGVPQSLRDQWKATAEAAFRAQSAAEMTASAMQDVGSPKTLAGITAAVTRLQGLEQVLIVARDAEVEGSASRVAIEQQLGTVTEKRLQLTQQLGRATLALTLPSKEEAEAAERAAKAREEGKKHLADMASQVAMIARGALAAADAFGTMSESTRTALTDVINLAEGVGRIIANPADAGAWVQSVGSAISLAADAIGLGDAMEEKKNRDANREVVARLREFADALDTAVANLQGTTGQSFSGVQRGAEYLAQQTVGMQGGSMITNADATLRAFGVTVEEAKAIAEAHDITLDGTVDSYRLLNEAMAETRAGFAEFGTSFADRKAELDLDSKAYRRGSSPEDEFRRLETLGSNASPFLWRDLAGGLSSGSTADLTPEVLAELRANAQELFEVMREGGESLDPALLKGMTPEEFRAYMGEYFDALTVLEDASTAAAEATLAAAAALAEYTRSLEDDLAVRELLADGDKEGADRLEVEQRQKAERDEAVAKGVSAETLARLDRVQAKELAPLDAPAVKESVARARAPRPGDNSVIGRAGAASVDTLIGIANTGLALDRERNAMLAAVAHALAAGAAVVITPPPVAVPGWGARGAASTTPAAGSGGIVIHQQNSFFGPVYGGEEVRASIRGGGLDIAADLQRRLDTQRRVEGRAEVI